jgi:hypothetical protein
MQRLISPTKVFGFGRLTQTAGTAIVRSIYPRKNKAGGRQNLRTRVTSLKYTAGVTAHTLTVMRPFGSTTLTAAAANGATVINIAADPQASSSAGALAGSDYLILELSDGTFQTVTVSSVTVLAVTIGTALAVSMALGARVWAMGVAADSLDTYALGSSATTTLDGIQLSGRKNFGIFESINRYEPIMLSVDNITNAGTLESVSGCYANQ